MRVVIKVLNVKDGDAVIVRLVKGSRELVFLIDGGRPANSEYVLNELDLMLKESKKDAPDFILCTHFDDDHIGGLFEVIKKYKDQKPPVWIHKTSEKINLESFEQSLSYLNEVEPIYPTEASEYLTENFEVEKSYYEEWIRNVRQEMDLLALIESFGNPCMEPLAENFFIEGWPELAIISPTKELYKELFPKKFVVAEMVENGELKDQRIEEAMILDPFDALDAVIKTSITPTNMNSAILMLTVNNKKFLFGADTGLKAFDLIPDDVLASLHWLKVPHHGSKNNINSRLIKLMNPKYAVISGYRHISPYVENCFSAIGSGLQSTRDNGDIIFDDEL